MPAHFIQQWPLKPQDYNPTQHRGTRRASFHDYRAPGYYLITISKHPSAPIWSTLGGTPGSLTDPPVTNLSPTGRIIELEAATHLELYPMFEFWALCIMPDHLHIVWRVKEWLQKPLGYYIGKFKGACTTAYNNTDSLFTEGFNDKIAYTLDIRDRFINYVNDNPRRRLLTMQRPEYFQRRIGLSIAGREFHAYGNFQLLRAPLISPVVISRSHTDAEKAALRRQWDEIIRSGGVLVSPFVSPYERAVMHEGIAGAASIIRIIPGGLYPKYKPSGMDFDLCNQGRLLHIGEHHDSFQLDTITYRRAKYYNQVAIWLASQAADCPCVLHTTLDA